MLGFDASRCASGETSIQTPTPMWMEWVRTRLTSKNKVDGEFGLTCKPCYNHYMNERHRPNAKSNSNSLKSELRRLETSVVDVSQMMKMDISLPTATGTRATHTPHQTNSSPTTVIQHPTLKSDLPPSIPPIQIETYVWAFQPLFLVEIVVCLLSQSIQGMYTKLKVHIKVHKNTYRHRPLCCLYLADSLCGID